MAVLAGPAWNLQAMGMDLLEPGWSRVLEEN